MLDNFHVAGLAQYTPYDTGWWGLILLGCLCALVAAGVTEMSKRGVNALKVPAEKRALWAWSWRIFSVLSGVVVACVLNQGFDLVFAIIGGVAGANASLIIKILKTIGRNKIGELAPKEIRGELVKAAQTPETPSP